MRHGRQRVKRVVSGGCHGCVARRGAVQVEAEIVGQLVAAEDVFQQFLVARAEQHHVVRHIGVLAAGAEVPDEEAHGVSAVLDLAVGPVAAVFRLDQVAVGPGGVGVRHHDVGRDALTTGQRDAGGHALVHFDALHLGTATQHPALPLQQAHQALHQLARATHGPVHAVLALQRIDEAVDAGDRKRVTADQQALQAHGHAQLGVLQVRRHHGVQAAPAAHLEDGRAGLDQVAHGVESLVAQGFKTQPVAVIGLGHETFVAG